MKPAGPPPVVPGTLDFGADFKPKRVLHATLGHSWLVQSVLGRWKHPPAPSEPGEPEVAESWTLQVRGPLPGNPSERGQFTMTAIRYDGRPGWWLSPHDCADEG